MSKCKKNETPIFIHSAAQSTGKYFDRRQVSRNTWVNEAKQNGMKPIFVLGLPSDDKIQNQLELEAKQYNDIIQFAFIDNYYNLTLKALSILRWAAKNCSKSDYVVKTDDDLIVNVGYLSELIRGKEFQDGLTGRMMTTRSNRLYGHKWYMPHDVYRYRFYRFLFGFTYVISRNSVKKLYRTARNFSEPVLDIDDLFVTGVLAQKADVLLFDDDRFGRYCGYDECLMKRMISMHGCQSSNETLIIWNHLKDNYKNQCQNSRGNGFSFDFLNFKVSFNFD